VLRPRGSTPMLPQMRRGRRGMHWPTAGQCPLVPELLPTLPAVQGALELVAADVSADVRFFAANLLLSKVRQGWGRLAPEARAHLAAAIRCHPDERAPSSRHATKPLGARRARRLEQPRPGRTLQLLSLTPARGSERQAAAAAAWPAAELVVQRLGLALGAVAAVDGPAAVDAAVSRGLQQVPGTAAGDGAARFMVGQLGAAGGAQARPSAQPARADVL